MSNMHLTRTRCFITKASAVLLLLVLLTGSAFATNGYFSIAYGTKYKGMAGAGVALSLSPMAAATNPGAMSFVGKSYYVGVTLFNPNRSYTVTGNPSGFPETFPLTPGTVESGSTIFFIPALAANWQINESMSFGLTIYGNGGMNTNYDTKVFDSPFAPVTAPTGVDLSQLFIAPTLSFALSEGHGIGITPIFAYQRFKAEGMQAFGGFTSDPTKLTNNDYSSSTGFGFRVGYLGVLNEMFSIGASYQSKISMSAFDNYAGLFAGQGKFDIPSNWTAGIALSPNEALTLAFDIQQIKYSEVPAISNPMLPNLMQAPLGNDGGAGFGWQDMTIFKIGAQYASSDVWTWRAGYSFTDQPIPATEVMFNILAPGVTSNHLTVGFSRAMSESKSLNVAIVRAFEGTVSGANPMEAPGQQTIELRMDQWELEVSFTF